MPSVYVPLLSEDSHSLLRNRLLETLTGGVTFNFSPVLRVPKWAYLVQLSLHQLPFFVGSIFTALVEAKLSSPIIASCLCGVTMTLVTSAIQIVALRYLKSQQLPNSGQETSGEKLHDRTKISYFDLEVPESLSPNCLTTQQIIAHIFPPKRCAVNYLVHPIFCGLITGYGVLYLLPSILYSLYRQEVVSYAIFVLGWLTVCVALYSLIAHPPPETATFRVVDRWEVKSLMRPFYVGMCYVADIVCRLDFSLDAIPNVVMHLLFTLLPLMWFVNVFPPLDALFLWFLEQVGIWLAGGSPCANRHFARFLIQLLCWSCIVAIICFIPKQISLLLCPAFGYILSLDLVSICRSMCCRKVSVWDIWDVVFFSATLMAVIFLSVVMYFLITPNSFQLEETVIFAFGSTLVVLYLVCVLTSSGQCVYTFGGLFRNWIYPKNIQKDTNSENIGLRLLQNLSRIRSVVMTIVAPFVLIGFVTLTENFKVEAKLNKSWSFILLHSVAVVRAFRWSWQQTESALLELAISYFLIRYTRLLSVLGCSSIVYLLMAFVVDRIVSIKSKCHMIFLLLVTSVVQEKQRRSYSCFLFVVNLVFYPVLMAVIVVAAILNAPILSLCTLPIFWLGFPRPTSFWPKQDRIAEDFSPDSIYYEEVIPNLSKGLNRVFSSGVLGNVRPGDQFLLRYENRLLWLTTVESGFGYILVVLKGLELQHTSCHAVEATTVDTILEWAFEADVTVCRINQNPFHVFSPKCSTTVETYVDTRNILTGVIDSPDTLHIISDYFPKCLIWVLLNCISDKRTSISSDNESGKQISSPCSPVKEIQLNHANETEKVNNKEDVYQVSLDRNLSTLPYNVPFGDDNDNEDDDDPWKDETDLLGSPPVFTKKMQSDLVLDNFTNFSASNFDTAHLPGSVDEAVISSFAQQSNIWHITAMSPQKSSRKSIDVTLEDIVDTSIPSQWFKTPLSADTIHILEPEFPIKWFEFVWERSSNGKDGSTRSSPSEGVVKLYQRLVLTCHYIVSQLSVSSDRRLCRGLNPTLVNNIFQGELPWSTTADWLMQNSALLQLVITSFRYAFKLALDQVLIGDIESESDLMERLKQYHCSWFIGPESEPGWREAIHRHLPNLFTLTYNLEKSTYNSHLLTRRPIPVYIGSLNRDAVNAVWSTLNLELLYLANDDEERYSIQAHSSLLRNLTVQAADPPLGYPIYISPQILVKLIPTNFLVCR